MKYHVFAFFLGFISDLILGDPYWLPHPIRLIGKLIAGLDGKLMKDNWDNVEKRNEKREINKGLQLVIIVILLIVIFIFRISFCFNYSSKP